MNESGKAPGNVIITKALESEVSFQNRRKGLVRDAVKQTDYIVDALIDSILPYIDCSDVEFINGKFIPNKEGSVIMMNDMYIKISAIKRAPSAEIVLVVFEIGNVVKKPCEVIRWLKNVHDRYIENMENDLGEGIMYFNQTVKTEKYSSHRVNLDFTPLEKKRGALAMADKQLSFTKTAFVSNKSFDNLYGRKMKMIDDRLTHFLNNRQWYDDRGIQYQFTLLLSGGAGRGKSSIVRAIANKTRRHIVNVAFHSMKTATQLKNLMFSPFLEVFENEEQKETRRLRVPQNKRILVFDELDASSPLVRERKGKSAPTEVEYDELTQADILNSFDGYENTEIIRVINTNHPELLDKAFKRPGRIDMIVNFGPEDDVDIAKCMFDKFFDRPMPSEWIKILNAAMFDLSPVEIQEVYFRRFGEKDDEIILADLLNYVHH